ncbi:hypothetical protein [Aquiflexum gelatinilyticum]|uniref:hypothetical protein n=1 Tax=Aquiflexum gelatinilyticum TaxID=2961943 RepID=UPI00216A8108|nr:hypothetical protein [Aquiflexum gelatinilyticum]MCS4433948.1 hypothetical protein [Aquiflexum gelatinilyticum]
MKAFYFFFLALLFFASIEGAHAQVTYTSQACTPSSGNPFTSSSCWVRTGNCNSSLFPPNSGTTSCPIVIVVNNEMTIPSLSLGSNITLRVISGGKLTITGNLTQQASRISTVSLNGGELIVEGSLILLSGGQNSKTRMTVDIRNGGSFDVTGGLMDIQNDSELIIDGDGDALSTLNVKSFNFGQRSKVDVLAGGGLFVEGDVDYRGNNSSINIYGFFRTAGSVLITGGSGNQLNAYGNAEVMIEQNLDVRGTSDITFGGSSETDIGGDILIAGNSKVIATDQAVVYVCGSFPIPCDGNNCSTQEVIQGTFSESCRILPVEIIYSEAKISHSERNVNIIWATAKEANNSHFEIERSIDGIKDFQKIGEVQGMGWKDSITEYGFVDSNLPLTASNVFYRIKQVDFDSKHTYSSVFSVKVSNIQFSKGVWRAYPNPTLGNELKISLLDKSQYQLETITFRIIHPSFISETVTVDSEYAMNEYLTRFLPSIPLGVFVIEVSWGEKVEHIKVLKKG